MCLHELELFSAEASGSRSLSCRGGTPLPRGTERGISTVGEPRLCGRTACCGSHSGDGVRHCSGAGGLGALTRASPLQLGEGLGAPRTHASGVFLPPQRVLHADVHYPARHGGHVAGSGSPPPGADRPGESTLDDGFPTPPSDGSKVVFRALADGGSLSRLAVSLRGRRPTASVASVPEGQMSEIIPVPELAGMQQRPQRETPNRAYRNI